MQIGVDFDNGAAGDGLGNKFTDGSKFKTQSPWDCNEGCNLVIGCEGWIWHDPTKNGPSHLKRGCWLKRSIDGKPFPSKSPALLHTISGFRNCF